MFEALVGMSQRRVFEPGEFVEEDGGYFVSLMLDEQGSEYALIISEKADGEIIDNWNYATSFAGSLLAGGKSDWKLPDNDEFFAIFWNLRPFSTYSTPTNTGASDRIVPPTGNYTGAEPAPTNVGLFRSGSEALDVDTAAYWTSTLSADNKAARHVSRNGAWLFENKSNILNARAVRRAYT